MKLNFRRYMLIFEAGVKFSITAAAVHRKVLRGSRYKICGRFDKFEMFSYHKKTAKNCADVSTPLMSVLL